MSGPVSARSVRAPERRFGEVHLGADEAAFRRARWRSERASLRLLLGGGVVVALLGWFTVLVEAGASALTAPSQIARLVGLAGTLGVAWWIERDVPPRLLDRVVGIWATGSAVLLAGLLFAGSRGTGIAVCVLYAVAAWVLLPTRLPLRLLPGLVLALAGFAAIADPAAPLGHVGAVRAALALVFANVIGAWGSIFVQDGRRQLFLADLEERRALADVERMQALVPVCPRCDRVRDDEGYWQELFEYLGHESPLVASHGICPDCFEVQMAELEPRDGAA